MPSWNASQGQIYQEWVENYSSLRKYAVVSDQTQPEILSVLFWVEGRYRECGPTPHITCTMQGDALGCVCFLCYFRVFVAGGGGRGLHPEAPRSWTPASKKVEIWCSLNRLTGESQIPGPKNRASSPAASDAEYTPRLCSPHFPTPRISPLPLNSLHP